MARQFIPTSGGSIETRGGSIASLASGGGVTVADSFENGDLSNYSVESSGFDVVDASADGLTAPDGSNVLRAAQTQDTNSASITSVEGDGLAYYPQKGDTIHFRCLSDTSGSGMNIFWFGCDSASPAADHYEVKVDMSFDYFQLNEVSGGGSTTLAETEPSYSANTWYEPVITWGDDISVELLDESGATVSTLGPVTNSTYASNTGVGWRANNLNDASLYFDHCYVE